MKSSMRMILGAGLLALGYVLGSTPVLSVALAQPEESVPSDETVQKIRDAHNALRNARELLRNESRYESVTKAVNPFAVLVGGLNVKEDLESGQGIDPESFTALSVAIYDIKKNNLKSDVLADWVDVNLFSYDNNGQLLYRNKVVRIYSISRLRRLNAQRQVILEELKEKRVAN